MVDHELSPNDPFPVDYLEPVKKLWADEGVKSAVAKGNQFSIHDNLF